jgi:hypothetical protein
MKILLSLGAAALLLLSGCSSKSDTLYYQAVQQQNESYMKSYSGVENESVTFNGDFKGEIKIVKPKKLPELAQIQRPKTNSEVALQWAQTIVPVAGMVAGMHYNYKSLDSSNRAQSTQIESITSGNTAQVGAYTSNYRNDSNDVTDTTVTTTNTSVDNTSNTTTTTSTQPTDVTTDGTTTTITNP